MKHTPKHTHKHTSEHPKISSSRTKRPPIDPRTSTIAHLEPRTLFNGSLAGVAYEDVNKNFARDAGEPALADTVVFVDYNLNGSLDDSEPNTVTDASGAFSLDDLPDGPATLRLAPTAARLESYTFNTIVPTGNGNSSIQLGAADISTTVTGVVFNDANNDTLRDPSELGKRGVTVFLDSNFNETLDPGELSAVTASDGSYTISGALPGITSVRLVLPSSDSLQTTNSLLSLTKSASFTANELGLYSPTVTVPRLPPPPTATTGTLTGNVFYDGNGNGKKEGKDFNLKRVAVYLDLNNNKRLDRKDKVATTDSLGNYTFKELSPGTYALRVAVPGCLKGPFSSQSVTVTAGKTTTATPISLTFAGFRHLFAFSKAYARMP